MSTVPKQPIEIPPHIDRDALAARHALAVGRSPVASDLAQILEREGPRGIWRRMADRDEIPAADAVRDFRKWVEREPAVRSFDGAFGKPPSIDEIRSLRGFNLCCWCAPGQPCHADVLLEIANSER